MQFKTAIRPVLNDIRFWLLLFLVVRLIGITNPPLESGHSWRQSLTNMVARNFYEGNADIRYPTIDIAGEKSGVMTSEFPVYNYLIYTASKVFGFMHWHGRWISLIFSTLGLFCYYQLIKQFINHKTALYATIITLSSLWFAYGRKIMPDTFSVSLVLIGLYFVVKYVTKGGISNLLAYGCFATLGVLSKIPALSLLAGLCVLPWLKQVSLTKKVFVVAISVLGLSTVYYWYFIWNPALFAIHDYQLFFPKTLQQGMKEIQTVVPQLLEKFYFSSLNSFVGFACFLVGVFFLVKNGHRKLQAVIVLISVTFGLFIVKTGSVFPTHSYYIIPFAPIMAFIAAYATEKLPSKFAIIIVAVIAVEGIANQQHDFFLRDSELYKLELESTLQEIVPPNQLVVINGGTTPQNMYFAHRKGWAVRNSEAQDAKFVDSLQQLGAKFLIIDKHQPQSDSFDYKLVRGDEHYDVYELKAR